MGRLYRRPASAAGNYAAEDSTTMARSRSTINFPNVARRKSTADSTGMVRQPSGTGGSPQRRRASSVALHMFRSGNSNVAGGGQKLQNASTVSNINPDATANVTGLSKGDVSSTSAANNSTSAAAAQSKAIAQFGIVTTDDHGCMVRRERVTQRCWREAPQESRISREATFYHYLKHATSAPPGAGLGAGSMRKDSVFPQSTFGAEESSTSRPQSATSAVSNGSAENSKVLGAIGAAAAANVNPLLSGASGMHRHDSVSRSLQAPDKAKEADGILALFNPNSTKNPAIQAKHAEGGAAVSVARRRATAKRQELQQAQLAAKVTEKASRRASKRHIELQEGVGVDDGEEERQPAWHRTRSDSLSMEEEATFADQRGPAVQLGSKTLKDVDGTKSPKAATRLATFTRKNEQAGIGSPGSQAGSNPTSPLATPQVLSPTNAAKDSPGLGPAAVGLPTPARAAAEEAARQKFARRSPSQPVDVTGPHDFSTDFGTDAQFQQRPPTGGKPEGESGGGIPGLLSVYAVEQRFLEVNANPMFRSLPFVVSEGFATTLEHLICGPPPAKNAASVPSVIAAPGGVRKSPSLYATSNPLRPMPHASSIKQWVFEAIRSLHDLHRAGINHNLFTLSHIVLCPRQHGDLAPVMTGVVTVDDVMQEPIGGTAGSRAHDLESLSSIERSTQHSAAPISPRRGTATTSPERRGPPRARCPLGAPNAAAKLHDLSVATMTATDAVRSATGFTMSQQRLDPALSEYHRLPIDHLPEGFPWHMLPPEWFRTQGKSSAMLGSPMSGFSGPTTNPAPAESNPAMPSEWPPRGHRASTAHRGGRGGSIFFADGKHRGSVLGEDVEDFSQLIQQVRMPPLSEILADTLVPSTASDAYQVGWMLRNAFTGNAGKLDPRGKDYNEAPGMPRHTPAPSFGDLLRQLMPLKMIPGLDYLGVDEWRHVVAITTRPDPKKRWSVSEVLLHPFFWDAKTKVEFVAAFADWVCPYNPPPTVQLAQTAATALATSLGTFETLGGSERKQSRAGGLKPGGRGSQKRPDSALSLFNERHRAREMNHAGSVSAASLTNIPLNTAKFGSKDAADVSSTLRDWVNENRLWLFDAKDWFDGICRDNAPVDDSVRYDYDNITRDMLHFYVNAYRHIMRYATQELCGGDPNEFATLFVHQRFSGLLTEIATNVSLDKDDHAKFIIFLLHRMAAMPRTNPTLGSLRTIHKFMMRMGREPHADVEAASRVLHRTYEWADPEGDIPTPSGNHGIEAALSQDASSDSLVPSPTFGRKLSRARSFKVLGSSDFPSVGFK